MQDVNVGVIGIGFIGPAHIEALRRLGNIRVVALAHSDEEKAKAKAELLGVEKHYGDYRELLEKEDVDVVHICTPNHLHYDMARASLRAGKHVVCEKPLAMDVRQAEELVELAESKNLINAVHFNVRYYPLMRHIMMMVAKGELGNIFSVLGSYLQDWLFHDTDYNWRLEPDFSGESRAWVMSIGGSSCRLLPISVMTAQPASKLRTAPLKKHCNPEKTPFLSAGIT